MTTADSILRARWQLAAVGATACLLVLGATFPAFAQATPPRRTCLPVSERAGRDVGCWIMAIQPLGQLPQPDVFWHLDTYPTRAAAEAAKGPRGTVIESLGKVWLFTIGQAGWRPAGGARVTEIGSLTVKPGEQYTAQYMEGSRIGTPLDGSGSRLDAEGPVPMKVVDTKSFPSGVAQARAEPSSGSGRSVARTPRSSGAGLSARARRGR